MMPPGDRKAEARAAEAAIDRGIGLGKSLNRRLDTIRRDADSGVGHAPLDPWPASRPAMAGHAFATPPRSVNFIGVGGQIEQHLADSGGVRAQVAEVSDRSPPAPTAPRCALSGSRQPPHRQGGRCEIDGFRRDRPPVERSRMPVRIRCRLSPESRIVATACRCSGSASSPAACSQPEHAVHGRADFVTHHRQEIRFRPVLRLRLLGGQRSVMSRPKPRWPTKVAVVVVIWALPSTTTGASLRRQRRERSSRAAALAVPSARRCSKP